MRVYYLCLGNLTMTPTNTNIFPVFDTLLQKEDKERFLKQKGCAIWMTGLSGSGKSTIAAVLEKILHNNGFMCIVLDGDNIRTGLCNNLGFSPSDRTENIRRIAESNKIMISNGLIVINCFVSPTLEIRNQAKKIIQKEAFIEVFIDTPIEECEKRDVKGLYKKARKGEIKNFTGIDAPFEVPKNADIHVQTKNKTPEENAMDIYNSINEKIVWNGQL